MLTLRAAANLLRSASSEAGLDAIARCIGFEGSATRLDAQARAAFALDETLGGARLIHGTGSLRALLFLAPADEGRALVSRVSARLLARAPHALWIVLAAEPESGRVIVAAATPGRRGARTASLVADRARVMDSDAETLRQLAAARSADDLGTHARFAEVLGRDALTRRFFRKLEQCVVALGASATSGSLDERREIALLYASRLLFLGFLESKGWLSGDAAFLGNAFDRSMAAGGGFHRRVLLPLFFGTLNTPVRKRAPCSRAFGRIPFLNGGLFTPTAVERSARHLRFSDEALGEFVGGLMAKYRFTTLEETASFEEAAVDPEMLGRAFESLMNPDTRRASGAFYTPHELVDRVTTCGLEAFLEPAIGRRSTASLVGGTPLTGADAGVALDALDAVRLLDPACGSGAFLVHALGRLTDMRLLAGDVRPVETIRREVLARSIFGVDVNPTAVWLCQLRLWLSIVVDGRGPVDNVAPLPNLDRNVRAGDSLGGPAFNEINVAGGVALRSLRERYVRSSGARKAVLARLLDHEERGLVIAAATAELSRVSALRRDLVGARRGRDLFGGRYQATRDESVRAAALRVASADLRRRVKSAKKGGPLPFSFAAHFADVAAENGFSVIVGNPPWVRPHHLDVHTRESLRRTYAVARSAPWLDGATGGGSGRGFASQVDLAAVFVERSLRLLAPAGALSLLLPSKLWRSLSAGGLRRLLMTDARIVRVEDYADTPAMFDAAVYPGLLVAARDRDRRAEVAVTVLHRSRTAATWNAEPHSIPYDASAGAPWLLLPPDVRRSFELVRERGHPLGETPFGRPLLGVKCGLNDAFLVEARSSGGLLTEICAANGRQGEVETGALRPVLRGEQVRAWRVDAGHQSIVWTHGPDGNPVTKLSDRMARWLQPHRRALLGRADARHARRWWSVFRTEAAASDKARVVWADIGRGVRATVLPAGDATVPLNSCYIARCPTEEDAWALCALLNSPLASAWLSVIAEAARGGYRRYLGWTMALLPMPRRWMESRAGLAVIRHDDEDLLDAAVAAYGLRRRDVDPLLAWAAE